MDNFTQVPDKYAETVWLKDPTSIASYEQELALLDAIPDIPEIEQSYDEVIASHDLSFYFFPDETTKTKLTEAEKEQIRQVCHSIEPGERMMFCLRDGDYMNQFWVEIKRLLPPNEMH